MLWPDYLLPTRKWPEEPPAIRVLPHHLPWKIFLERMREPRLMATLLPAVRESD